MRRRPALAAAIAALQWGGSEGYPLYVSKCRAWKQGDRGYMGAMRLLDGSDGNCEVDVSAVPGRTFTGGVTYVLTVKSTQQALYKLYTSDGQCLGSAYSLDQAGRSFGFSWTAPRTPVEVHAICGVDYQTLYAATPRMLAPVGLTPGSEDATPRASEPQTDAASTVPSTGTSTGTPSSAQPTPAPPAPEATTAPPPAGAPAGAQVKAVADLPLVPQDGLTLSFEPKGASDVQFTVRIPRRAWVGVGVAADSGVPSMGGAGRGSDVVICTGSAHEVRRYLVTGHFLPQEFALVPVAQCSYESGATTLTFSRSVAALSGGERAVTPGTPQSVIFAYGADGEVDVDYHAGRRNGITVDFGSGGTAASAPGVPAVPVPTEEAPTTPPPAAAGSTPPPTSAENGTAAGATGAQKVATVEDLTLVAEDNLTLSFRPGPAGTGGSDVQITVKLARRAWLGVGVAADSGRVSMGGGGGGSDVVICSGASSEVTRHLVTGHDIPQESEPVPGAQCSFASGVTTMTFSRSLLARSGTERPVTPGTPQSVIFAYGKDDQVDLGYHDGRRNGVTLDFGSGKHVARTDGPPLALVAHLALMCAAWGLVLPFGASVASRTRDVPGAPKGAWFKAHWHIQVVGWVLQLLGAAAAVVYVSMYSEHLESLHAQLGAAVTLFATLQPLNAAVRPKPDTRSLRRVLFESVHKWGGWLAIMLGLANLGLGYALLTWRYQLGSLRILLVIAAFGPLLVVFFFTLACVAPNNAFSRWLVGAQDSEETSGDEETTSDG